ncbi:MAG: alpha-amylase [Chitinophagaceae bacterium]|nr:MAG: alpha-amylase [Chitinophagaceae bacterium]
MNKTLFQFFHWYYSPEGDLWNHAKDMAPGLAALGVTDVWLPPAYKSADGVHEPGYAVYDLYDLGEFNQKGTVRTRYGTKAEYIECIRVIKEQGMGVIADIVLNHKMGGDEKEKVPVQNVNDDNRLEVISEQHTVEAHTKFTFPGRKGKYSKFKWDWHCFTGICEDGTISAIINEYGHGSWEPLLEQENGNFDYLMGDDIEFRNPLVREELKQWGVWYVETTGVTGFRLDAVKHISPAFFPEWLDHLRNHFKHDFFTIGEYWRDHSGPLLDYQEATGHRIQLFDVPLHFNFYRASLEGRDYDMRSIFDNSLVRDNPFEAITFVDNHDTQPLQSLESTVDYWFKPHAYAIIMLREAGTPCVFYPAVFEAKYTDHRNGEEIYIELNKIPVVEPMIKMRRDLCYGIQGEYFDDPNIVGWTKQGEDDKLYSGLAVLLSNADDGDKWMGMGRKNAGRQLYDICGGRPELVTLDENGEGRFFVNAGSVSVWVDNRYHID